MLCDVVTYLRVPQKKHYTFLVRWFSRVGNTQASIDKLIKQRVDAAIPAERERVRNERPAGGPTQGPAATTPTGN
nr:hypothetical protein [Tanacetum cinerariifolium]